MGKKSITSQLKWYHYAVIAVVALFVLGPFATADGRNALFAGDISSILSITTGSTETCEATPYDSACMCPDNTYKIPARSTYHCTPKQTSNQVSLPIGTWGEAFAYLEQQGLPACPDQAYIVTSQQQVTGERNGYFSGDYSDPIGATGKVLIECKDNSLGRGGIWWWETLFRPDTGKFLIRQCNDQFDPACPPEIWDVTG